MSRAVVWCPTCQAYAAMPAIVRRDQFGVSRVVTGHRHRYVHAYTERFGRPPARFTEFPGDTP